MIELKRHAKNEAGNRYGLLTVVRQVPSKGNDRAVRWLCRCDCGMETSATGVKLREGGVKSCGCITRRNAKANAISRTKHGRAGSPIYMVWRAMLGRCRNPNDAHYGNYGGRGIAVCARWESFENFLADMGERPDGMTLERRDSNKGYGPDNCVWASRKTQSRNTRRNRVVEWNGERRCVTEWAERLGIDPRTLLGRIAAGWPPEVALTKPVNSGRYRLGGKL